MSFDFDAYAARIGWTGGQTAAWSTLTGVLQAHMTAIPFENLDVLLGRSVRLDLDAVAAKLVDARRGGYCFEHGTLVQAALAHLGFAPVAHTARVLLMTPRAQAPLTHMCLTVIVDGERYVLDPGFGGHGPVVPVPLSGEAATHGRDAHRLIRSGQDWVLEATIDGQRTALWCATLEPAEPADVVMGNHFVSTFPASPFVNNLMLRAITPAGRISVFNRDVTVRASDRDGVERRSLADRGDLRRLLAGSFGFDLPGADTLRVPAVAEWGA